MWLAAALGAGLLGIFAIFNASRKPEVEGV
jgi:hypothetical protein